MIKRSVHRGPYYHSVSHPLAVQSCQKRKVSPKPKPKHYTRAPNHDEGVPNPIISIQGCDAFTEYEIPNHKVI